MPKITVPKDEVVKLDHRTHIYKLPDTYIGSIEKGMETQYLKNDETGKFVKEETLCIPGEYKIFDEIIVNALDQYIRTNENTSCSYKVKTIDVNVDKSTGEISVKNDGEGIKIEMHSKEKVYNPELIFGHLLTSTNYNEKTLKHVGGKNGYGAKLTNIFSKQFYVETCDGKNIFKQTFYDNMSRKDEPIIKKSKDNQYTLIKYIPDYAKFKIDGLSDNMMRIMEKRTYDVAACANLAAISFNDVKLNIKSFKDYVNMYIDDDTEKYYEKINNRWEVVVCLNDDQVFEPISFVNGINTSKGGKHVDYIVNQITKKLSEFITKKKKMTIKPQFIKDNIRIFIKCTIDNPSFSGQTKEYMTTNKDKFGSECIITDKFITQVSKIGIIERAIELFELKNSKGLKKNDGKKQNRLKGLPKLEDANWAGTKKSDQCTLILTEGDSAKAMAMAGMSIIGRDKYGVFPLKGKILNVKDNINGQKIIENAEISNVKKIIGLASNKDYKDTSELRYGKVLILTDQDEDGTHIKGLIFNLFESLWPNLYRFPGFLNTMLTPVIKVKHKVNEKSFYSVKDYDKWCITEENSSKWNTKYYKGLGTSTPKEAKEYFKKPKFVNYTSNTQLDSEAIHLAFSKNDDSANKRKDWLSNHTNDITLDYKAKSVSISDFINFEMVYFSRSDCVRSLPNIIDGLKPSQRKVIFCCFKRNLTSKEIRVAQLAGYVSEHGAYHHGEMSLHGTIINMAQDYVGSNNIGLLEPIGQFGTRCLGGKDSAQPRYIHTKLMPVTSMIFNKLDEPIYKYNQDDGQEIEPVYFAPILPMVLINGSQGIGTGWSTDIPKFNPLDILTNIKNNLEGKDYIDMIPYSHGFKGTITKKTDKTFISKGVYEIKESCIIITELPIGMWTDVYKVYLESLIIDIKNKSKKQIIRYYNSYSTDVDIKFEIFLNEDVLWDLNKYNDKIGMTNLEKMFKLISPINLTNMVAFDSNNKIKKYNEINDILDEYCNLRLDLYDKRKTYLLDKLQTEIDMLSIKIRFIREFIDGKIIINNRSKINIMEQLEEGKYPKDNENYDYLLKMPIYNLTKDKIDEFNTNLENKESEYNKLLAKDNKQLWIDDLTLLEPKLSPFKINKKLKFKFKVKAKSSK
jgi:DNA topoisomerase II